MHIIRKQSYLYFLAVTIVMLHVNFSQCGSNTRGDFVKQTYKAGKSNNLKVGTQSKKITNGKGGNCIGTGDTPISITTGGRSAPTSVGATTLSTGGEKGNKYKSALPPKPEYLRAQAAESKRRNLGSIPQQEGLIPPPPPPPVPPLSPSPPLPKQQLESTASGANARVPAEFLSGQSNGSKAQLPSLLLDIRNYSKGKLKSIKHTQKPSEMTTEEKISFLENKIGKDQVEIFELVMLKRGISMGIHSESEEDNSSSSVEDSDEWDD